MMSKKEEQEVEVEAEKKHFPFVLISYSNFPFTNLECASRLPRA